jgi:hypothetical protein
LFKLFTANFCSIQKQLAYLPVLFHRE